jgi:hypothetical protein
MFRVLCVKFFIPVLRVLWLEFFFFSSVKSKCLCPALRRNLIDRAEFLSYGLRALPKTEVFNGETI